MAQGVNRIAQEVDQNLFEASRIPRAAGEAGVEVSFQDDFFHSELIRHEVDGVARHRVEIGRLALGRSSILTKRSRPDSSLPARRA